MAEKRWVMLQIVFAVGLGLGVMIPEMLYREHLYKYSEKVIPVMQ